MRIFITGGTGYVGRAVTRALAAAGHEVLGLVRTPERGDLLARLGGVPLLGDLCSPTGYAAAAGCDAVVYMAAPDGPDRQKVEKAALEQLLSALRTRGGPRSLIYTSVLFVLGHVGTEPATEGSPVRPVTPLDGRPEHESLVLEAAGANLSTAVVRPGMVYGGGAGGAVSELFRSAVEEGAAVYVGSGQNRWSLVHRDDVAALYRLILERGARGVFNAVDGHPLPAAEVARLASRAAGRGGATRSLPLTRARRLLGYFADSLCLDQPVVAPRSRGLGWMPEWPAFPEAAGAAFAEWRTQVNEEGGPRAPAA